MGDIRDIKPPLSFAGDYLLFIILAGITILAALVFLSIFLKKKLKRKTKEPLLAPKSPHQIAREALLALQGQNLPGMGRTKEYYFRLSDIARRYIENRFNIKAPEMTTEEFLFSLKDSAILSALHKELLKEFLTLCDIVKFAKYGPTPKEIDESFNAAARLLEETKSAL